jgi:predicted transcriptional regulator
MLCTFAALMQPATGGAVSVRANRFSPFARWPRDLAGRLCYINDMTKEEIQALLERVRTWPLALQEEAAQTLLAIEAMGIDPCVLSDDERRGVERGLEDVRQGRFASDESIAALFAYYKQ